MSARRGSRWAWHLLLALLMLCMQQGALRHGISHLRGEEGVPAHPVCLDCLSFHAGDQAVSADRVPVLLADLTHVAPRVLAPRATPGPIRLVYLARAPPHFS